MYKNHCREYLNKTTSTSLISSSKNNFLIRVSGVSKSDGLNIRESVSASSRITDK